MHEIHKSTLEFLSDLKYNNDREWFSKNRKRYDAAKLNYEKYVQALINEITGFEPILKGLEAKSCTYRINRDIRFSPDKTIYKTHMGAFIVKGGKKNGDKYAGYYFHIEPGNSLIAGGAYMPPSGWLNAIREKIDREGDDLVSISRRQDFVRYFGKIEGERLKTAPKGYPRDHPYIELLKLKSYLVEMPISDKDITGSNCFELVVNAFKAMKPLNDYLNNLLP